MKTQFPESFAKLLAGMVKIAKKPNERLNKGERAFVAQFQEIDTAGGYASSQTELGAAIGCEARTIINRLKDDPNAPKEHPILGWPIAEWQKYYNAPLAEVKSYNPDPKSLSNKETGLAYNHERLERETQRLNACLNLAIEEGDLDAEKHYRDEWLNAGAKLVTSETTIKRHNTEIGETISVKDMHETIEIVWAIFFRTFNSAVEEVSIKARACESEREFLSETHPILQAKVLSGLRACVTNEKLEPTVAAKFEKLFSPPADLPKKKAAKKKTTTKKK